jgi:hypothetical protein
MQNPITPYLIPGVLVLVVLAFVFIAAHKWDVKRQGRNRQS